MKQISDLLSPNHWVLRPYVLAIDFDNTLTKSSQRDFPLVKPEDFNKRTVGFVRLACNQGWEVVVWTGRHGEDLICARNALDPLIIPHIVGYNVNLRPERTKSNKIYYDLLIDDAACNLHLMNEFVDEKGNWIYDQI